MIRLQAGSITGAGTNYHTRSSATAIVSVSREAISSPARLKKSRAIDPLSF
jgi:hypothetical protein